MQKITESAPDYAIWKDIDHVNVSCKGSCDPES